MIDILIPTRDRPVELATTLAGLAAQTEAFDVIVSDQSGGSDGFDGSASFDTPSAEAMARVLRTQGRRVEFLRHLPRRGLAEQRAFLLERSSAPLVLFLDDDVWLTPGVVTRLRTALRSLRCGLVGAAVQGLSYLDDERPHQTACFEEWPGPPCPEQVTPDSPAWARASLHLAANLCHIERRLALRPGEWRAYKIAWVGGCVLFDRAKLVDSGGFDFWPSLPAEHVGEDVAAQLRVMARYGGAGIIPSGAIHLEAPTTMPVREVDAPKVLPPAQLYPA
ncbi:MAG TPA: glycosyltransferase [Pseudonocardiaceae bacterium]|nr:glycosyltransferase [Pseudonocardiaceae bacterium]